MKHSLAIVGASARAAAASAARAGFQPIAADLFADADLRQFATATRISPYPEGLLDWLRVIEPPAWMYTGALENHPELVDQMAWIAPLWGNPGDVLQRVRSPWQLAVALRDAGFNFPETRESPVGLPDDGTWLAKTYRGASGSGVSQFPLPDRVRPGEVSEEQSFEVPIVYQRRIPGQPCAAAFAAIDGTANLLGITRQLVGEPWLGAQSFQYAGSIGLVQLSSNTERTVERIGDVLVKQFELSGLFGVDFILNGDQVWPLEVNPRYTASVEICERATGIHAVTSHAAVWQEASTNKLNDSTRVTTHSHGKAILFAKRGIVISEAFAETAFAEATRTPWPTLADVSPAGTPIEAGRPIITVFATGATGDDVEQQLRHRIAELEKQLYAE